MFAVMHALDLLLRSATFALAIAAAVAIMLRPVRNAINACAAFAVAGIGAFVVASAPGAHSVLGPAAFAFDAWCLAAPVAVWLLARLLFSDRPSPAGLELALAGALVVIAMAGDYGRFHLGPLADEPQVSAGLLFAGATVSTALFAVACGHAILSWRADLIEQRRRARVAFVAAIAVLLAGVAVTPWALALLAFVVLQFVARGGMDELLPVERRQPQGAHLALVRNDAEELALARRARDAMERERLWKRRIDVAGMARHLAVTEPRLRGAIHHHLGYRNFTDLLHDYRLREAASRLADPGQWQVPLAAIASDCGYASARAFHRAFKARFGQAPAQYRNRASEKTFLPHAS